MAVRTLLSLICLLYAAPLFALPDLRVELLFATEENDNCVSQVHYTIQVLNIGDEPVEGFDMHLFYHAPEQPGIADAPDWPGEYIQVDYPLDTWDMYQMETYWKELPDGVAPGSYSAWLLLDPDEQLLDADRSNNIEGPVFYQVNAQMCNPGNLLLQSLDVDVEGSSVTYVLTVINQSQEKIPIPFRMDLYHDRKTVPGYNDPGDEVKLVDFLGPGESVTWETQRQAVPEGVYKAWAVVDGTNTVIETTEADNVFGPVEYAICPSDGCPPEPVDEALQDIVSPEPESKEELVSETAGAETTGPDSSQVDNTVDAAPDVQAEPEETKGSGSGCSQAPSPCPAPFWLLLFLLLPGLRVCLRTGTLCRLKYRSTRCL